MLSVCLLSLVFILAAAPPEPAPPGPAPATPEPAGGTPCYVSGGSINDQIAGPCSTIVLAGATIRISLWLNLTMLNSNTTALSITLRSLTIPAGNLRRHFLAVGGFSTTPSPTIGPAIISIENVTGNFALGIAGYFPANSVIRIVNCYFEANDVEIPFVTGPPRALLLATIMGRNSRLEFINSTMKETSSNTAILISTGLPAGSNSINFEENVTLAFRNISFFCQGKLLSLDQLSLSKGSQFIMSGCTTTNLQDTVFDLLGVTLSSDSQWVIEDSRFSTIQKSVFSLSPGNTWEFDSGSSLTVRRTFFTGTTSVALFNFGGIITMANRSQWIMENVTITQPTNACVSMTTITLNHTSQLLFTNVIFTCLQSIVVSSKLAVDRRSSWMLEQTSAKSTQSAINTWFTGVTVTGFSLFSWTDSVVTSNVGGSGKCIQFDGSLTVSNNSAMYWRNVTALGYQFTLLVQPSITIVDHSSIIWDDCNFTSTAHDSTGVSLTTTSFLTSDYSALVIQHSTFFSKSSFAFSIGSASVVDLSSWILLRANVFSTTNAGADVARLTSSNANGVTNDVTSNVSIIANNFTYPSGGKIFGTWKVGKGFVNFRCNFVQGTEAAALPESANIIAGGGFVGSTCASACSKVQECFLPNVEPALLSVVPSPCDDCACATGMGNASCVPFLGDDLPYIEAPPTTATAAPTSTVATATTSAAPTSTVATTTTEAPSSTVATTTTTIAPTPIPTLPTPAARSASRSKPHSASLSVTTPPSFSQSVSVGVTSSRSLSVDASRSSSWTLSVSRAISLSVSQSLSRSVSTSSSAGATNSLSGSLSLVLSNRSWSLNCTESIHLSYTTTPVVTNSVSVQGDVTPTGVGTPSRSESLGNRSLTQHITQSNSHLSSTRTKSKWPTHSLDNDNITSSQTPLIVVPVPTSTVVEVAQATTKSVTVISAITSSPTSAVSMARLTAMQAVLSCELQFDVSDAVNLISLTFGPNDGDQARGAIVGNVLIVVICGIVLTLGITIAVYLRRRIVAKRSLEIEREQDEEKRKKTMKAWSFKTTMAIFHCPGAMAIPMSAILQPTLASAVALFYVNEWEGDIPLGIFGMVVCVGFAAWVVKIVMWKFPCELQEHPKYQSRLESVTTRGGVRMVLFSLLGASERWTYTSNPAWRKQHSLIFEDVRTPWYVALDVAASVVIGIVTGLPKSSTSVCIMQAGFFFVTYVVLVGALWFRPMIQRAMTMFCLAMNTLGLVAASALLLYAIDKDTFPGGANVVSTCALIMSLLALIKTVSDIVEILLGLRAKFTKVTMYYTNGRHFSSTKAGKSVVLQVHGSLEEEFMLHEGEGLPHFASEDKSDEDDSPFDGSDDTMSDASDGAVLSYLAPTDSSPHSSQGKGLALGDDILLQDPFADENDSDKLAHESSPIEMMTFLPPIETLMMAHVAMSPTGGTNYPRESGRHGSQNFLGSDDLTQGREDLLMAYESLMEETK
jgi:hypothetical protein